MRITTLFLVLILLLPVVSALQVSPAEQTITSNEEKTFTFTIRTTSQEPITIRLEGPLQEYTQTPTNILPSATQETFDVTINPPDNLTPGRHDLNIIISQRASSGGNVAATAEIMPRITYIKTYQGSFIEPIISPINSTRPLTVNVLLQNFGEQTTNASISFSLNQEEILLDTQEVLGANNKQLRYNIPSNKGEYALITNTQTNEQELTTQQQVLVGKPRYTLTRINSGRLQEITPITLDLASDWNTELTKNVQATIRTNNEEFELETTPTTILANQETTRLTVFWEGATAGEHELVLQVDDQKISRAFSIQEPSKILQTANVLYLLIGVALLFVLLWFQTRRKLQK